MNRFIRSLCSCTFAFLLPWFAVRADETPIDRVLKQIDPVTGKVLDPVSLYQVSGVVSARTLLADGKVLAFVHPVGEAGLLVLAGPADAGKLTPRNKIGLAGVLGQGPLGLAVLLAKDGSINVLATNQTAGAAELCGAGFFKDATSLAGRYVSLTNVVFTAASFDGSGRTIVKGEAGEAVLLVTTTLRDRPVPAGQFNIFGVPVKVNGEWCLLAARFISINNKAAQAVAAKRTCFTCHNPDTKTIGPAYRDVAAKYKDAPDAMAAVLQQIEKGGGGKWGPIPMPPFGGTVPLEDRKLLADWILGYRWDAFLAE